MTRLLVVTAAALALSATAASAQAVYVTPGYSGYVGPTYVTPSYGYTYAVPAPAYVVPTAPAWGYAAPLYNYAPTYGTYVVGSPAWEW